MCAVQIDGPTLVSVQLFAIFFKLANTPPNFSMPDLVIINQKLVTI